MQRSSQWRPRFPVSPLRNRVPGLRIRRPSKLERTGVMYYVGHPSLAEPLLEEALALREQSVGLDHLTVATTLTHLGSVYHALGKDEKARMCLQRALAIREKVLGSSHPAVNAVHAELRLLSDRHFATVTE